MVELYAKTPLNNMSDIEIGSLTLKEISWRNITTIQPFKGKEKTVSKVIKKSFELNLPGVGKSISSQKNKIMWIGMNQFLFLGDKIKMKEAALTDQSDAWTILLLTGDKTAEVMDRLCPVDTRSLMTDDVIRSMIGHMTAIVEKTESGCQLMVFRAFAETILHEVCNSMRSVPAQEKLKNIG